MAEFTFTGISSLFSIVIFATEENFFFGAGHPCVRFIIVQKNMLSVQKARLGLLFSKTTLLGQNAAQRGCRVKFLVLQQSCSENRYIEKLRFFEPVARYFLCLNTFSELYWLRKSSSTKNLQSNCATNMLHSNWRRRKKSVKRGFDGLIQNSYRRT